MGNSLFHVNAVANCPHAGVISTIVTNPRVKVSAQPVATFNDTYLIAGCPFTLPNGKYQPCIKVRWVTVATRVRVNNQPVVLQTSTGLCLSAEEIPQGTANIIMTQPRVKGI